MRLDGKSIVIVGGTTGIGLSAAKACIASGARVVCVGRSADRVAAAQGELGECGHVIAGDACDRATAPAAIAAAIERFGEFHGLYHVAGGSGRRFGDGPLHEITPEGWARTLELNLTSVFHSAQAAVQQFFKKGSGGSVVLMASVLGYAPAPRHFATHAYSAAKAAIIGLTRATAAYYAPRQIRVNAIACGLIETPMSQRAVSDNAIRDYAARRQPLDPTGIGNPADADGAAVYLLSDAARFVTGQVLAIDGGWSVGDAEPAE